MYNFTYHLCFSYSYTSGTSIPRSSGPKLKPTSSNVPQPQSISLEDPVGKTPTDRSALFKDIHEGTTLRHTVTDDRSGPVLT